GRIAFSQLLAYAKEHGYARGRIAVASGPIACAIRADGTVACWGEHGERWPFTPAPTTKLVALHANEDMCGATTDGRWLCLDPANAPFAAGAIDRAGGTHWDGM